MLSLLGQRFQDVLRAVAPLFVSVTALQLVLAPFGTELLLKLLAGLALVVAGMVLLLVGVEIGLLPMGRFIGAELPQRGSWWLLLAIGMGLGFAVTVAEPDVLVLAGQVEAVSDGRIREWGLVYLIAAGVGLFVGLGLLRILLGFSMPHLLIGVYGTLIALTLVAEAEVIPVAYDAGSVTTGVLTAPVVLAFARGVSSVLARRAGVPNSFGLLGLASAGAIFVILIDSLVRA